MSPGTTAALVRSCLEAATDHVVVGVRTVTDTVKELREGYVGPTVDRDSLVAVCAPVVVPAVLVGALPSRDVGLVALVDSLRRLPTAEVEVPAAARRLADASELALL